MSAWEAFTWLGDSALLLPGAAMVALWLAVPRATRPQALLWVAVFGGTGFVVALSKFLFLGWGVGSARLDFTGFSGHTALSTCFWPVALWLIASSATHRLRVALACVGWAIGAGIGLSRLAIEAHSLVEVVAGFLLGGAASAFFLALQRTWPHPRLSSGAVLLTMVLPLMVVEPGWKAPTHEAVAVLAVHMAGHDRAFTRADLHQGTRPRQLKR